MDLPVSRIWTFMAGVGAVVGPLIFKLYREKRRSNGIDGKRRIGHTVDNSALKLIGR